MGNSSAGSSHAASSQVQRGNQNQFGTDSQNITRTLSQLLPPGFQNILNEGLFSLSSGLTGTPNLGNLYGQFPIEGTAPLNPNELSDIQALQRMINPSSPVSSALTGLQDYNGADLSAPNATYQSFMGSVGKPSQATQAALKEFKDLQAPEILQQAALMGRGTSGGALNALATGQEEATVPFMQQDLANSLAAAQGLSSNDLANSQLKLQSLSNLGNLGLAQEGQSLNTAEAALNAATLPQTNAQTALNNLFNQQTGKFNFASGVQTTPQNWFSNLINTIENTVGTTTSASRGTSSSASSGTDQGSQSQPKL